jgi:hypothetical protein
MCLKGFDEVCVCAFSLRSNCVQVVCGAVAEGRKESERSMRKEGKGVVVGFSKVSHTEQ